MGADEASGLRRFAILGTALVIQIFHRLMHLSPTDASISRKEYPAVEIGLPTASRAGAT